MRRKGATPPPASEVLGTGGEEYALLEMIGEGTFSVVHKARRHSDGSLVAVKRLKPCHMQSARVRDEAGALLALGIEPNPNVVGVLDAVRCEDGRVDLVMP
jgi:serine/threonine protein kinase